MGTLTAPVMYTIQHVFLPPKLPKHGDKINFASTDRALLQNVFEALGSFEACFTSDGSASIGKVQSVIKQMISLLDDDGHIKEEILVSAFSNLSTTGCAFPIYVRAQNAAVIVRNEQDTITFETFGLSPPNHEVLSTKGRLERCFPGSAVAVPLDILNESGFQSTLARTLAKMSHQGVTETRATTRKAGQMHIEERDGIEPYLVTEFLTSFLKAVGTEVSVPQTWKNTREEVMWSTGLLPWRRSPVWLLARVAMQTSFSRLNTETDYYKQFMVFFMAQITAQATALDLPSDILHCLVSKTSRRLSKLGPKEEQPWLRNVQNSLGGAIEHLQASWDRIVAAEPDLSTTSLAALDFKKDCLLQLPVLDAYITFVKQLPSDLSSAQTFSPFNLTTHFAMHDLPKLVMPKSGPADTSYILCAFEHWVSSHLMTWLDRNISQQGVCGQVRDLSAKYHTAATSHYTGNPENISIMVLTCMELWIAGDRAVTRQMPLLLDYKHEVPFTILQSLLLPLKTELERLSKVEDYLKQRAARAKLHYPSVFSSFADQNSFAVRYFATSTNHQNLLKEIENWARDKKERKKAEFKEKKAVYNRLKQVEETSSHETVQEYDHSSRHYESVHIESRCNTCASGKKAREMRIVVDEWPLPQAALEAQATVFELDCPKDFNDWRDATMFLNISVLRSDYKGDPPGTQYGPDSCLSKFMKGGSQSPRLRLISQTKPHVVTHRSSALVSGATEASVCLNNGLSYEYLDSESRCLTGEAKSTDKVPRLCTYQLQSYKPLQRFIYRPHSRSDGPQHNAVISEQHACPSDMSLEEFKTLGTLPLGLHLQWSNILLQLSLPSIDFKKMDTGLVVLQVIRQCGPRSGQNDSRDGQRDLQDESFGRQLLQALDASLGRVKENWESRHALESFIAISSQLLSLTNSQEVTGLCRDFLRSCRQVTLDWAQKLRTMSREATSSDQRDELLRRVFETALTCAGTYDVDLPHLKDELQRSSEAAIFIHCSIMVHDTSHVSLVSTDTVQNMCVQRWRRLSHRALPLLLAEIAEHGNTCADIAVGKCWSGYRAGSGWRPASGGAKHWVTTETSAQSDAAAQLVQYNLLSGELRVDGLPLSRLPTNFEQHAMYKILFERSTVEVMRTTLAGMQFSAMNPFRGYEVAFAMRTFSGGSNLDLMLACTKGGQSYNVLPSRIFNNMLPDHFIKRYVHWYHSNNDTVEFRPIEDPWTSPEDCWTLSRQQDGWMMTKGNDTFLASMTSHTGKVISGLLSSIESVEHMHLVFRPSLANLDVHLPRLKLNFVLRKKSELLKSRQFRGMFLDPNQRIKTLVGLKNKLVLKNVQNHRTVLIPDGSVSWSATLKHVEVRISRDSSTKVYPFELDKLLRRIVDNGTLESKLALCYLHALTSFCLPDGLTGQTGTEQALEILNSAAVWSYARLSDQNVAALQAIAKLTPHRAYYPAHLRVMQDVTWVTGLSPLSQHGKLYADVARVLEQASSLQFFDERKKADFKVPSRGDRFLIDRDLIRSSVFRSSGFGAEYHTADYDKTYQPRTTVLKDKVPRSESVFCTASRIYRGLPSRQTEAPKELAGHLWSLLSQYPETGQKETVCKPLLLEPRLVNYDAERLEDWEGFLAVHWCQLHHTLSTNQHDKFSVMMLLATLAYAPGIDLAILDVLVACFNVQKFGSIKPPVDVQAFDLRRGHDFRQSKIRSSLETCTKPFYECPEYKSPALSSETSNETWDRRKRNWKTKKEDMISSVTASLKNQWPCKVLQNPDIPDIGTYIDITAALTSMAAHVEAWWDNHRFYQYLCQIAQAVKMLPMQKVSCPPFSVPLPPPGPARGRAWLTDADLLSLRAPSPVQPPGVPADLTSSVAVDAAVTHRLMDMIGRLAEQAKLRHEKEYVEDLQQSSEGLRAQTSGGRLAKDDEETRVLLKQNVMNCKEHVGRVYASLVDGLNCTSLQQSGGIVAKYNSPRVTPTFFLKQLARKQCSQLPPSWKDAIVAYGVGITALQRAKRLRSLVGNKADLIKELLNPGHENWSPHDSPESLLIEVESGILIRKVQAEIANEMKHPSGNHNSVMQLNMGEGKSSVIVPIVASALADGSCLVRVIVAKPQSKQMFQMLVSKLGGLCERQIYHMPFSRSLKLGQTEVNMIAAAYRKCMETGGILLLQPEHILSFQLMGVETNLSGDKKVAITKSLLSTQHFFNTCSRDIVDESDENFSVKFELVYTMGTQRPIDWSPDRWTLVQFILGLIRKLIPPIHQELPSSVELEHGPAGSFPRTRILRADAQERLCHRLGQEICESTFRGFPIARQSLELRNAVLKYITEPDLSHDDVAAVEEKVDFWTDAIKPPLLLLRGLIAGGVLAFAFCQKRWRVNYGLTPTRRPETRLAVPYRAKDSPALRSEFSHPDVVVVLTCLSYYYGGLDDKDLFTAFEHLMKSDQADTEYVDWVEDAPNLPSSFRSLTGINLKDKYQCTRDIFPHLRQAQAVVDFFLARIVFPKEMKEFPHKLSASGWDIGKTKSNPTTGFSGTNDSKHLLPLTVHHLDLDEQRHTNALVLQHLLQDENSVEIMTPVSCTKCADAVRLLQLVVNLNPQAQVILDVGAQVIELSNIEVAKEWLKMTASHPVKQAVVFFDDGDNLMVCDRAGHVEAFQTSPYSKQLDLCYVFLDEAHTRGTDLKLPQDYRAAVTLGAGLTKDRLVQACMRMRKLGKGQSVVFCIPEEIRVKILAAKGESNSSVIDVSDVLIWSIDETYTDLRRSMPLWAAQGTRFERQRQIWDNATTENGINLLQDDAEKFLEQEALSIEDRYRPRDDEADAEAMFMGSDTNPCFSEIRSCCERFESTKFTAAALQEEQERELSPEIEAERQVEKPKQANPAPMSIHPDVKTFVRTGVIASLEFAFKPAFQALDKISAAVDYNVCQFPQDLLVTTDFARTVELAFKGKSVQADSYQRPVQWLLTTSLAASDVMRMVIISPFEAHVLKPLIKTSTAVHLHLYAPRSNLSYQPLDDLKLYVVPPLPPNWTAPRDLVLQLNLFAGQLYFRSYDEYKSACELLGLAWKIMDGGRIEPDGFIVPNPWDTSDRKFWKSPTRFLQVLLATIRRDGRSIGKTHWGRVLGGEILKEEDFEVTG